VAGKTCEFDRNSPICWIADALNGFYTSRPDYPLTTGSISSYSVLTRTLCNWYGCKAGLDAISSGGWRFVNDTDLTVLAELLQQKEGSFINTHPFCSTSYGVHVPACSQTGFCNGALNNWCQMEWFWRGEKSARAALESALGEYRTSTYLPGSGSDKKYSHICVYVK